MRFQENKLCTLSNGIRKLQQLLHCKVRMMNKILVFNANLVTFEFTPAVCGLINL